MNTYERRNKIIDLVNESGSVLVADLSSAFEVSEVTVRSDLSLLAQKGCLAVSMGAHQNGKRRRLRSMKSRRMR